MAGRDLQTTALYRDSSIATTTPSNEEIMSCSYSLIVRNLCSRQRWMDSLPRESGRGFPVSRPGLDALANIRETPLPGNEARSSSPCPTHNIKSISRFSVCRKTGCIPWIGATVDGARWVPKWSRNGRVCLLEHKSQAASRRASVSAEREPIVSLCEGTVMWHHKTTFIQVTWRLAKILRLEVNRYKATLLQRKL
jgi:hypothetical protein